MIRWFKLGGVMVRMPDSWDVVVVKGVRYIRRMQRRAIYWVDERGKAWWRTPGKE